MPSAQQYREYLRRDDLTPDVRARAEKRLAAIEARETREARERRQAAESERPVSKYRVNGRWVLDRRIADRDPEADFVNGYSDGAGAMGAGRTLRPVQSVMASGVGLLPEPDLSAPTARRDGWGLVRRAEVQRDAERAESERRQREQRMRVAVAAAKYREGQA